MITNPALHRISEGILQSEEKDKHHPEVTGNKQKIPGELNKRGLRKQYKIKTKITRISTHLPIIVPSLTGFTFPIKKERENRLDQDPGSIFRLQPRNIPSYQSMTPSTHKYKAEG